MSREIRTTRSLAALVGVLASVALTDVTHAQNPPVTPPATQPPAAAPARGGGGGRGGIVAMTLTSSAFTDGGMIPMKHAQAGHDVSPPLSWSGVPDSTRGFVLVVHDADARIGDGTDDMLHWMVWNMPATMTSLPEGVPQGSQAPKVRQISGTGPYYRGPAAPATGPVHHYIFELYAVDNTFNVPAVGQSAVATRAAVMSAIAGHMRGKATLVGLYRRAAP